MLPDIEPRMLNNEGKLVPFTESCLVIAERTFFERKAGDTKPQIVQMILYEELVPHWYYRSTEWINQPYYDPGKFLPPYRGPADQAPPEFYGEGTYIVDEVNTKQYTDGVRCFTKETER